MIIGSGTRAALESIPGLAEAQPLTHVEALELEGPGGNRRRSHPWLRCLCCRCRGDRGAAYTALRGAILAHPTLLEGLNPLFSSVPSEPKATDAIRGRKNEG